MRGLRPTARGLGVGAAGAALLVLGILTGTRGPYALAALAWLPVLMAPVVVAHRAGRCRGLTVHLRAVPALVAAGDVVRLDVTETNRSGKVSPPVGVDRAPRRRGPGPTPARTVVAPASSSLRPMPPLRPGASHTTAVLRRMGRRGRFDVGSGRVWVHDHFGLCAAAVTTVPPVTVVVHPAPIPVPVPAGDGAGPSRAPDVESLVATTGGRGEGELTGLRPYVPGDRLHLVHWPSMSRSDGPFVKEFAAEPAGVLRVVVDDRAGMHRRGSFEEMLGMTVALLNHAAVLGWPVELSTMSGRDCTVTPDPAGLARAMSFLAEMRPRRGGARRWAPLVECTVMTTSTAVSTLSSALHGSATFMVAS